MHYDISIYFLMTFVNYTEYLVKKLNDPAARTNAGGRGPIRSPAA